MEYNYSDEITIDLMDMVRYLLKRWKSLAALLLVCAVLGGGYAMMQPASAEYVPSAADIKQMDQAYMTRQIYEEALEAGTQNVSTEQLMTNLNSGRTMVKALEDALKEQQKLYYQVHYLGIAPTTQVTESPVKWAVIGAFLGCVIWGLFWVVKYLLDPTLKTAGEVEDGYRLPLLGCVSEKGSSISYLTTVVDRAQEGKVLLCGDGSCEAVKAVMDAMAAGCAKIQAAGFISESEEALEQSKDAESEILLIKTWQTKRKQLRRELEMCRLQKVKVLGVIVVD